VNGDSHHEPATLPHVEEQKTQVRLIEPEKPEQSEEERETGEYETKAKSAKAQGFTGAQCSACGSMKVKQNGSCQVCVDCGETTGCS